MSSTSSLLPWLAAHVFYLICAILLLYLAYVLFKEIFRRRSFPSEVDRRVDNVVLTESGTRKVFTESGSRPAATSSGSRPAAPPSSEDKPR
jgi:hypothetical protein